ncbi:MAG: PAC2 family protein [Candidatus Methanospirareceae archaeon]
MGITRKAWVTYHDTLTLKLSNPIAIVGAPGLRSVGKLAVDMLIEHLEPRLYAEIYSYGFPSIYYGPSYLGAPSHAGGLTTKDYLTELPSVKIYIIVEPKRGSSTADKELVLISGYQAYDPLNQHMVVDRVTDVLKELGVKRVFSLGAQVIESGTTCCATDTNVLAEMNRYGITQTHVDRFIGFSGLVAALAMMKGIEGVCLFSGTTQNTEDPEYPDLDAAQELVVRVAEILGIQIDTADFEQLREHELASYGEQEPEEIETAGARERKRYSEDLDGYV